MSLSYSNRKPLAIDLYAGLGGWAEGFIAEGYDVVGFDIERHQYGDQKYPGQLVLQDALTIHGFQFRNAAIIVCSPPCQQYSWLAMPWSRSKDPNNSKAAKALRAKWEAEGPDNRLFDACFRIQREAIEATKIACTHCSETGVFLNGNKCYCCDGTGRRGGRYIPLIVENVRGAQPWVGKGEMPLDQWLALSLAEKIRRGRSAWHFGSFHLWGDVPALMPISMGRKNSGGSWFAVAHNTKSGHSQNPVLVPKLRPDGIKGTNGIPGGNAPGTTGKTSWFFGTRADPRDVRMGADGTAELVDGTKIGGDWFSDPNSTCRKHGSGSQARKAASAQIAKIPLALSSHIAMVYKPRTEAAA